MASLLTSRMPSEHGVLRLRDRLDDRWPTLAEALGARGFATAGVVSHFLIGAAYGFDRGFGSYDESPVAGEREVTGGRTTDAALAWLDRRPRDRPFFLFVHYFDPHYPYLHHPAYDFTRDYRGPLVPGLGIWDLLDARPRLSRADVDYLVGLYREEIAYTDAEIGRLLDRVTSLGLRESTLVVVTADHGEEFMRHGWIGHTRGLYDDMIHVPLLVSQPGRIPPRRLDTPVSLVDLLPTLLELSGGAAPAGVAGVSLAPLLLALRAEPAVHPLFAEVSFASTPDEPAHLNQKTAFKTALLDGDLKLIHDLLSDRYELYDRGRDPEEQADLFPGRAHERGDALRARLTEWERSRPALPAGARGGPAPGPEVIERLKALGYLP